MSEHAEPRAIRGGLSKAVTSARERLREQLPTGGTAAHFAEYSRCVVGLVSDHIEEASRGILPPGSVTVLAAGALGRDELLPFSDLDLFVLRDREAEGSEAFETWMRSWLHPLWDAELKVQIAVHDEEGWLKAAETDLPACTSLLDMRHVWGARIPMQVLGERAREKFFGERRGGFLQRIAAEVHERHRRYGTTVYRVEPDLKHGPGGARDLSCVGWATQASFGTRDLAVLEAQRILRPRVVASLSAARTTILRLRAALHLGAGRPQDRLGFPHQERIPSLLEMVPANVGDDALVEAIERFMQGYYRAASDVLRYGPRVVACCSIPAAAPVSTVRVDERFELAGDELRHTGADPFSDSPLLALEALALARDRCVPLAGRTVDAILDAASGAKDEEFEDPRAHRLFLDLLTASSDPLAPTALEQLHDLGLLERIVPEFGPCRGRMQHASHHVYTVDQHSLSAVEFLKSIARGEHRRDLPLATAVHLALPELRPLYLSTLLHDVGKPLGDQCAAGARVVETVAARVGLDEVSQKRCALLVREHLTMPMLSQKRDLGDPLLVEEFVASVSDAQTLAELYLLSLADMATVAGDFLTSWKRTLLDELYLRALATIESAGRIEPLRREGPDEPVGLPDRYYSLFDVELRRHHGALIEELRRGPGPIVVDVAEGAGAFRLTIVTADRPGLLALLTAAFSDFGLSVVAADLFTVPGDGGLALDVFRLAPGDGREGMLGEDWLARLRTELVERMSGERPSDPAEIPPLPQPDRGRRLRIEDEVSFAEDPAGERTIVEVRTADQPGVLMRIAAAFASLGIDIEIARLGSEARGVDDVFYVARLSDPQRDRLRARILETLRRK